MAKKTERGKAYFMISAVSQKYNIHPQTLRLYERQGLLKPSRTEGNTRLYTDADLERLELILNLTRDLGVNLAGVEIVLNRRLALERVKRFEFLEMKPEPAVEPQPGLDEFLKDASLSGDATKEEIEFLKSLKFRGRRGGLRGRGRGGAAARGQQARGKQARGKQGTRAA